MIDIYSKHDNMHKNGMFYALICFNNHIIFCINYMLSKDNRKIERQCPIFAFLYSLSLTTLGIFRSFNQLNRLDILILESIDFSLLELFPHLRSV